MFTQMSTVTAPKKQEPPARCWSDGNASMMGPDRPLECMAISTTPLGLCDKHYEEIVGHEYLKEQNESS